MDQLTPSKGPIHSNMWIGREPTNRELSSEFSNLYRLVESYREELNSLREEVTAIRDFVGMPDS